MSEHKKPGPKPRPINHGTLGGYRTHYRRGEPICDACRDAQRAARGHKAFRAAECGTRSGYGRHLRLGEEPCSACREAHRQAANEARRRRSQEPLPSWDPRHGRVHTYSNHGCRCAECTAANARKSADRRKRLRERAMTESLEVLRDAAEAACEAMDELVRTTEELGLYDEEQP